MRSLFGNRFSLSFYLFIFLMIIYSVLRVGFYLINNEFFTEATTGNIIHAFLLGLRFDASAILMINLPLLILFNIPFPIGKIKYGTVFLFYLFCLTNLTGIGLNIADFGYYPTIQRRLLYEPYTAIGDTIRMIPGLLKNYAHLILGLILSIAGFIFLTNKLIKRIYRTDEVPFKYPRAIISLVLLIVLSIIGIRGGLQLKPIRHTNAFFTDNRPLGFLALNSTYTVVRSLFQYSLPDFNLIPENEARSIIEKMCKSADERMLDSNYPFLRRKLPVNSILKKNIVIFIMESWSAEYIGSISGKKTFTPFFDSLSKQGILFTNFLASGQRSIEAVPSILASLPAIFPNSIIGSRSEINKVRGLGSILAEHSYITSFHHGALHGSMGFDAFVTQIGFQNYFGKEDFEGYADSLFDGTWGIYDEPFFIDATKKFNTFKEPFCSVVFSLSSHDPFHVPSSFVKKANNGQKETDYEKSIRYSDYSLGMFFNFARKQKWFENTVFLFTADHTLYTTRNDVFSSFHVPFLIYAPGLVTPQINPTVGTHADILPTLLDLLNIPTDHASMGKSLLDSSKEGFGITTFFPIFLYFSDSALYVDDLEKKRQYFSPFSNSAIENNTFETHIEESDILQRKLKAYIQSVSKAVNKDLIYKNSVKRN